MNPIGRIAERTTAEHGQQHAVGFPCHGVGGLVGMIMTGLLAHTAVNGGNTTGNGLFFGEIALFQVHMIASVIVVAYTFFGSLLILKVTDLISALKVSAEEKEIGQDVSQHGENVYSFDFHSAKQIL